MVKMPVQIQHKIRDIAAWAVITALAVAPAISQSPHLLSTPYAKVARLAPPIGRIKLSNETLAYIPPNIPQDKPAPLLVLLHGAGGKSENSIRLFKDEADRRGLVLLAPHSQGQTWDILNSFASGKDKPPNYNSLVDPGRVDTALKELFALIAIDPERIALSGFSDGASYALFLGTSNPQLFHTILAFSPGMALVPDKLVKDQRFFLSHGTADQILSYEITKKGIVEGLRRKGVTVEMKSFNGGHTIPANVRTEALDFFLTARGN
jgi:phospholipase/carboxylesterase